MPPKAKFTGEQIISAALEIVESEGEQALTARALGAKLGCSARPIFTVFDCMEQVKAEVVKSAKALYAEYVGSGLGEAIAFKGVGMAYIRFAAEHPRLFMMLFMSEVNGTSDIRHVLGAIDDNSLAIRSAIIEAYGLSERDAERLYIDLWIYTHGIAALIATHVCVFSEDEASDMLTRVFIGSLKEIKQGGKV